MIRDLLGAKAPLTFLAATVVCVVGAALGRTARGPAGAGLLRDAAEARPFPLLDVQVEIEPRPEAISLVVPERGQEQLPPSGEGAPEGEREGELAEPDRLQAPAPGSGAPEPPSEAGYQPGAQQPRQAESAGAAGGGDDDGGDDDGGGPAFARRAQSTSRLRPAVVRAVRFAGRVPSAREVMMSISRDAADERRDIASGKVPFHLTEKARLGGAEGSAEGLFSEDASRLEESSSRERSDSSGARASVDAGLTLAGRERAGSLERPLRAELSLKGIVFPDISYAQAGRIRSWDALAAASRGVIAMKVRQTAIDPFFDSEGLKEAERRGMIVIGYAFGYGVDGSEQADALLRSFRPRPGRILALDLESNAFRYARLKEEPGKVQGDMDLRQAEDFVNRIRARTGEYPLLYTGAANRRDVYPRQARRWTSLSRCPSWVSAYTKGTSYWDFARAKADIHQFTSGGRFPGIALQGGLDLNELLVPYGTLRRWAGLGSAASPSIAGAPFQGLETLGKEVLARAWLVADHIRAGGGFRADGQNDAYGFIRRTWDPFLSALGRENLPVGDAPSLQWERITDWRALRPGDILSTHPGHAVGSSWHGGLCAGVKNGEPWVYDNAPGLGAVGHAHDGRFRFYYRPVHDLLLEDDGPLAGHAAMDREDPA